VFSAAFVLSQPLYDALAVVSEEKRKAFGDNDSPRD
jgi:hypothetical protein